jgi:membrane associated rhomboid family serine protease
MACLWRPHEVMNDYKIWMILGQILMSVGFVALFTKAFKRGSIAEGAIYGLLVAIIFMGTNQIIYAVAPYPISIIINWRVEITIQLVLAGVIVALIFRNKSA